MSVATKNTTKAKENGHGVMTRCQNTRRASARSFWNSLTMVSMSVSPVGFVNKLEGSSSNYFYHFTNNLSIAKKKGDLSRLASHVVLRAPHRQCLVFKTTLWTDNHDPTKTHRYR